MGDHGYRTGCEVLEVCASHLLATGAVGSGVEGVGDLRWVHITADGTGQGRWAYVQRDLCVGYT